MQLIKYNYPPHAGVVTVVVVVVLYIVLIGMKVKDIIRIQKINIIYYNMTTYH